MLVKVTPRSVVGSKHTTISLGNIRKTQPSIARLNGKRAASQIWSVDTHIAQSLLVPLSRQTPTNALSRRAQATKLGVVEHGIHCPTSAIVSSPKWLKSHPLIDINQCPPPLAPPSFLSPYNLPKASQTFSSTRWYALTSPLSIVFVRYTISLHLRAPMWLCITAHSVVYNDSCRDVIWQIPTLPQYLLQIVLVGLIDLASTTKKCVD
jgi:hypothetical protein